MEDGVSLFRNRLRPDRAGLRASGRGTRLLLSAGRRERTAAEGAARFGEGPLWGVAQPGPPFSGPGQPADPHEGARLAEAVALRWAPGEVGAGRSWGIRVHHGVPAGRAATGRRPPRRHAHRL